MTKEYSTPIAEQIAFNYRDQVVAASGDPVSEQGGQNAPVVVENYGSNVCGAYDNLRQLLEALYICNLFG